VEINFQSEIYLSILKYIFAYLSVTCLIYLDFKNIPQRLIHINSTTCFIFIADEEIGGVDGMQKFVKTQEFKNLKIGFALDEGMASTTDEYLIFYGERYMWSKCNTVSYLMWNNVLTVRKVKYYKNKSNFDLMSSLTLTKLAISV
jgi:hypothetical protein